MPARVPILAASRERLSTGRADRPASSAPVRAQPVPWDIAARSAKLIVRALNRATQLVLVPHDQLS